MKENGLKELYIDVLRDIRGAEDRKMEILLQMAKAATSPELQSTFEQNLEQTRSHITRLTKIVKMTGEDILGKKCKAMEGLNEEGKEMIGEGVIEGDALDAGLISIAQRVEHYQIAAYGCVSTYAGLLGQDSAAELLEQSLVEEKEADRRLAELAEEINTKAQAEVSGPKSKKKVAGD